MPDDNRITKRLSGDVESIKGGWAFVNTSEDGEIQIEADGLAVGDRVYLEAVMIDDTTTDFHVLEVDRTEPSERVAKPSVLPSFIELARLPRWARTTYALRCLQRVRPIVLSHGEFAISVEKNGMLDVAEGWIRDAIRHGIDDPVPLYVQVPTFDDSDHLLANGTTLMGHIVTLFAHTMASVSDSSLKRPEMAAEQALLAARLYGLVIDDSSNVDSEDAPEKLIAATRHDYNWLRFLSRRFSWSDSTVIDLDLLGPLWPYGMPSWCNHRERESPGMMLEFSIPQEVDRERADELIGEIAQRANELHHAFGGTGLTFADIQVHECEPAMVPVGGDDDGGAA